MLRMLLAVPGIHKDVVDCLGRTPLMAAKDQGNEECVKLLEGTALKVKRTCPEENREANLGAKSRTTRPPTPSVLYELCKRGNVGKVRQMLSF